MGLRPGRCYRKPSRPYTRVSQKKPRKGYIKGVPTSVIAQFEQGKKGDYSAKVFLLSDMTVQIRHNALESARIATVQGLDKNIKKGASYFFKIRVFPHQVLRENALATGAGADRFQQGMRQSFGKPIGTAARVKTGQRIFEIQINKSDVDVAKLAFKKASHKLPMTTRIEIVE